MRSGRAARNSSPDHEAQAPHLYKTQNPPEWVKNGEQSQAQRQTTSKNAEEAAWVALAATELGGSRFGCATAELKSNPNAERRELEHVFTGEEKAKTERQACISLEKNPQGQNPKTLATEDPNTLASGADQPFDDASARRKGGQ
ncbi:hypothetical protein TRVL_08453 [Trypanosoma vivax]|nr:hypothetical protein TRVL_08453 [Trypanosoma vivax]